MGDLFSLKNKTALVTGASMGIGQAVSIGLANAGAHVICADCASLANTIDQIKQAGGTARELELDLRESVLAARIASEVMPVDILVNSAGINCRNAAVDFSEKDWDGVLDVDLKSSFFLCREFAKSAFDAGRTGKIINIASIVAYQGGPRGVSYTVAKSGVVGMTRSLANEWGAKGILVNAIAPGFVETNMTRTMVEDPKLHKDIAARIPLGRWGKPEDMVGAAIFLASRASDYVNGSVLTVDGGWLVH